jgi:hypothetical protein
MIRHILFRLGLWLLRANLKVLRLRDGDILVLESNIHRMVAGDLVRSMRGLSSPKVAIVSLDPNGSLEQLSDADLKRAGLVRRPKSDYSKPWTEQLGTKEKP